MCAQNNAKALILHAQIPLAFSPWSKDYFLFIMDKKRTNINIRVTPFDKVVIQANAKELNISVAEYLTTLGTRRQLPKAMSSEELEEWKRLKTYETNFARISNFMKHKSPELEREIREVTKGIKEALKIIRDGKSS